MLYFVVKRALSGIIIAAVSEVAKKRSPAFGGLIVSLPLVSLLGILCYGVIPATRNASPATQINLLVRAAVATDVSDIAGDARAGIGFWPSPASSCAVAAVLYFIIAWVLARFGIDP